MNKNDIKTLFFKLKLNKLILDRTKQKKGSKLYKIKKQL